MNREENLSRYNNYNQTLENVCSIYLYVSVLCSLIIQENNQTFSVHLSVHPQIKVWNFAFWPNIMDISKYGFVNASLTQIHVKLIWNSTIIIFCHTQNICRMKSSFVILQKYYNFGNSANCPGNLQNSYFSNWLPHIYIYIRTPNPSWSPPPLCHVFYIDFKHK